MTPLISIIVPVYECADYLEDALDSIQKQTYQNFEVIIVYTESSDNTKQICNRYCKSDSRFKMFINNGKKNAGSSRNIGLHNANGQYIGFVDGDDIVSKDMFNLLINNIQQYDADISICAKTKDINSLNLNEGKEFVADRNETLKMLLEGKLFFAEVWDKIFSRKFIQEFPEIRIAEDLSFVWDAISSANRIVISTRKLYFYRENPKSTIKVYKIGNVECNKIIYDKILNFAKKKNISLIPYVQNRMMISYMQSYLSMKLNKIKDCNEYRKLQMFTKEVQCNAKIIQFGKATALLAIVYEKVPFLAYVIYKCYKHSQSFFKFRKK